MEEIGVSHVERQHPKESPVSAGTLRHHESTCGTVT